MSRPCIDQKDFRKNLRLEPVPIRGDTASHLDAQVLKKQLQRMARKIGKRKQLTVVEAFELIAGCEMKLAHRPE